MDDTTNVPANVLKGTQMTKASEKRVKKAIFRIDPDEGAILWDSRKHGMIPIESIKELRFGQEGKYDREHLKISQADEDRWMSIIYVLDGEYKTLNLITESKDDFEAWKTTLKRLHEVRQGLMDGLGNTEVRETAWQKQYWRGADLDGDQRLDFSDISKLCKRLDVNCSAHEMERLFKDASNGQPYLDFAGYQRFVKLLKRRSELDLIYLNISEGTHQLNLTQFTKFMKESQKSTLTQEEIKNVFEKYMSPVPDSRNNETETAPAASYMSQDKFSQFLMSKDNPAFPQHERSIWQDMTRPMSEYYISSSHNTYLVGHQLVGVSTIEGYIRALLHGCRSVEMDIYDGDGGEPVVYHGKTLTSKVLLRDICRAIAKYGFVASPYPIIISAEVHCGLAQQDTMVKVMQEVFGDALVQAPVEGRPKLTVLPSPEDLKGKFLLKAKNLIVVAKAEADKAAAVKAAEEAIAIQAESDTSSSSSSSSDDEGRGMMGGLKSKLRKARTHIKKPSRSKNAADKPKPKMSFALASLLVYTVGVKCRGLSEIDGEYAPEHIFSLSESAANKMIKQGSGITSLIRHNLTHVSRIYPKGLRVDSTNYEPHRYWSAGAQIVAINWQTFDLGYMINQTMFRRNGRCGFVLKPEALRKPDDELLTKRTRHFFDVTVISAQQLPRQRDSSGREVVGRSAVDPLVEVSLHIPDWTHSPFLPERTADHPNASVPKYSPESGADALHATSARTVSYRTRVVKDNGFNPVWQEEMCLPFDCVGDMKELIFVRFTVWQKGKDDDDDDEPLAVYCTSLGSLCHGFRHLPLHDTQMAQHLFSTLFVKIGIRDVAETDSSS